MMPLMRSEKLKAAEELSSTAQAEAITDGANCSWMRCIGVIDARRDNRQSS